MKNPIKSYKNKSYEQKTIIKTTAGLCFSAALAAGKFVVGLFYDYNLCIIALYTLALGGGKAECVRGAKSEKNFKRRNAAVAIFLMISSAVYIAFMCAALFRVHEIQNYRISYVAIVAFIAFAELGFALAGIFKTKNKGQFYRDIKIINFCIALMAILTAQVTILDFTASEGTDVFNAAAGIGIGVITAACAVYVQIAPYITVQGKEHNSFMLENEEKNELIPLFGEFEIVLCKSAIYGSYIYRARAENALVDGYIVREKSLWKRLNIFLKVLCCILSEILIFVWLAGRFVFFIRSANLPKKLTKIMQQNGYKHLSQT